MESGLKAQQAAGELRHRLVPPDGGRDSTKPCEQAWGAYVKPLGILIEGLKPGGGRGEILINISDACPGLTWCANESWCSSKAFLVPSALNSLTGKLDMDRI